MATYTDYYRLIKPDEDDYYFIGDMNQNTEQIEEILAGMEARIADPEGIARLGEDGKVLLEQLPVASTEAEGVVRLNDTTESESDAEAATAGTVKRLADRLGSVELLLEQVLARLDRLEDMIVNDVTGEPFLYGFGNLNAVSAEGVWNEGQQRIEF